MPALMLHDELDEFDVMHLVWMDPVTGAEVYVTAETGITQKALKEHGIERVLTVNYSEIVQEHVADVEHAYFPFKDAPKKDQTEDELLNGAIAVRYLMESIKQGKKIVVHCHAGMHRSTGVVHTALIMLGHFENAYEAHLHVKRVRRVAGLVKSLNKWLRHEYRTRFVDAGFA